jgi:flavorubredoxin
MTTITEIAPDIFRISTYDSSINLQFVQFLVRDEEPLLFHTGLRSMFPSVRDAVAKLIDPDHLRWISFSHFEADECGSLNDWLQIAPNAQAACSTVGALVSLNDFSIRPVRSLQHREIIDTGKYQFQFDYTPQVPHAWDAGLLFETTHQTLLCSDLFHQFGDVEASTTSDIIDRARKTIADYEQSDFPNYMPWTSHTERILQELANLHPKTLATMHGSTFVGEGAQAIRDLSIVMREELKSQSATPVS